MKLSLPVPPVFVRVRPVTMDHALEEGTSVRRPVRPPVLPLSMVLAPDETSSVARAARVRKGAGPGEDVLMETRMR